MPVSDREYVALTARVGTLETEVGELKEWRAGVIGAMREQGRSSARLLALTGLVLTALNIAVDHLGRHLL